MNHRTFKLLLVTFVLGACGSEGAVGDACGESGAEAGECEEGAVCGKQSDDSEALECLVVCKGDGDCPADRACKGVSGTSIKGCRDKDALP